MSMSLLANYLISHHHPGNSSVSQSYRPYDQIKLPQDTQELSCASQIIGVELLLRVRSFFCVHGQNREPSKWQENMQHTKFNASVQITSIWCGKHLLEMILWRICPTFLQFPMHNFSFYLQLVLVYCMMCRNERKTYEHGFVLCCHIRHRLREEVDCWCFRWEY